MTRFKDSELKLPAINKDKLVNQRAEQIVKMQNHKKSRMLRITTRTYVNYIKIKIYTFVQYIHDNDLKLFIRLCRRTD